MASPAVSPITGDETDVTPRLCPSAMDPVWRSPLYFTLFAAALCAAALAIGSLWNLLPQGNEVAVSREASVEFSPNHVADVPPELDILSMPFDVQSLADAAFGPPYSPPSENKTLTSKAADLAGDFTLYGFQAFDGTTTLLNEAQRDERTERLRNGRVLTLYHQTTPAACRGIMSTGFRIGRSGLAGPGIYFAQSARSTGYKAEHFGCMIQARVYVGNTKRLGFNGDRGITGAKLLRKGYDSVWMPRGLPVGTAPEWVVYFPDQIANLSSYPCRRDGRRWH